jgi:hypothetical protein
VNQAARDPCSKRTIEEAAVELLAALIIGQVVSMLTFESTQALSDAVDAGLATRLTATSVEYEHVDF